MTAKQPVEFTRESGIGNQRCGNQIELTINDTPIADNNPVPVQVPTGEIASVSDPYLEISIGNITGQLALNKFGRANNGIQTTMTDIWDRADATPTQQIWLAPTAARIHTIASSSVQDTTGGTGVNTVTIKYLPNWNTAEQTEVVTGNLNAGIAMTNAAVIINRMESTPQASTTNNNAGIITATAAVDATVTAQININEGQTQMAIYGIPSTQTLYLTKYYGSIHDSTNPATAYRADILLVVNPNPNVQTKSFLIKHSNGLISLGTGNAPNNFMPYYKISGPAIIKVQMIGSAADGDASAGFDGILVTN